MSIEKEERVKPTLTKFPTCEESKKAGWTISLSFLSALRKQLDTEMSEESIENILLYAEKWLADAPKPEQTEPSAELKTLADDQKDLDPRINKMVNEKFFELLDEPIAEPLKQESIESLLMECLADMTGDGEFQNEALTARIRKARAELASLREKAGAADVDHDAVLLTAAWIAVLAMRRTEPGYTDEGAAYEAARLGIYTMKAIAEWRKEQGK